MNSYSKRLLFGVSIVLCFSHNLSAEKIVIKYKTGGSGTVEVLGVEGESVKLKSTLGNTRLIPLRMLDEDSLVRVIVELGRQKQQVPVVNNEPIAAVDQVPVIDVKRLEVFGERYIGKPVRFVDAEFSKVDQHYISDFPMTQIKTNGLITTYRKKEAERWVGFAFKDTKGAYCYRGLAHKEQWAELLLSFKKGQKINLEGIVVDMPTSTEYGFIATSIKPISEAELAAKLPKPSLKGTFTKPTCEIQLIRVKFRNEGKTESLIYQITNHSKYSLYVDYKLLLYDDKGDFLREILDQVRSPLKPGESRLMNHPYADGASAASTFRATLSRSKMYDSRTGKTVQPQSSKRIELIVTKQLK